MWNGGGIGDERLAAGMGLGSVAQGVEEGFGLGVGGVFRANDFDGKTFEWGLGGNAFEPAGVRELFVIGEIEPDDQAEMERVRGVFRVGRRLALETHLKLAAEAEGLLPSIDAMTGLLGSVLVPAEIEYQIGLRHEESYSGQRARVSSGSALFIALVEWRRSASGAGKL